MNVTNFIITNLRKILGLTFLFFGLGLLFLPLVHASDLSPCPPQGPFHDCFGSYTWTSGHREGDRYLGEFKNNKFHGYGTYLWAPNTKYVQSGSIYSGQWKNGVKDGQGTYIGADGDKFTGQWRGIRAGSVMEGFGIHTWNDEKERMHKCIKSLHDSGKGYRTIAKLLNAERQARLERQSYTSEMKFGKMKLEWL